MDSKAGPRKTIVLSTSLLFLLLPRLEAQDPHPLKASLIPEMLSVEPGKPFCLGLLLSIDEGWHTYWKNPGDAGIPTTIEWRLPAGWAAGSTQWPFPGKFDEADIITYGYRKEAFLITEMKVPDSAENAGPAVIAVHLEWLVCRDGCIPGRADLSLELPIKREKPPVNAPWSSKFRDSRAQIPAPSGDWDIRVSSTSEGYALFLKPPLRLDRELKEAAFFAEESEVIDHSAPQKLSKSDAGYVLELKRSPYSSGIAPRLTGVLFVERGWDRSGKQLAILLDQRVEQEGLKK